MNAGGHRAKWWREGILCVSEEWVNGANVHDTHTHTTTTNKHWRDYCMDGAETRVLWRSMASVVSALIGGTWRTYTA